jgi:outer membrane protein OmpA-like peptidoglycan-associated protein
LTADRTRVQVGEAVNFRAQGNSPDGRPLTYQWSTTGGSVVGTGPNVRLDTAGAQPGTVTVRVRATDDRNLSAEASQSITVEAPPPPPPPPQTVMLDQCEFALNSARVDNVCKAKLDSVALRMQSEPDATLAIVGFADSAERNPQPLAQARADNVRVYLSQDKGIAAALLSTRTGAPGSGAQARKAEMHLVPRGATFAGSMLQDAEKGKSAQASPQPSIPERAERGRRVIATTATTPRPAPGKAQEEGTVVASRR